MTNCITEDFTDMCQVTILDLPDEILDNIFCYLDIQERLRTEFVCRRWREVGQTAKWSWPNTLKVNQLQKDGWIVTNDVMSSILYRCGTALKKLDLNIEVGNCHLTSEVFDIIGESCPNLTELTLGLDELLLDDPLHTRSLVNLANGCSRLSKVFFGYSHNLNDDTLASFLVHCHSLTVLILTLNFVITEKFLDSMPSLQKLKGLYIFHCNSVNIPVVSKTLLNSNDVIEELCLCEQRQNLKAPLLIQLLQHYRNTLKKLYFAAFEAQPQEWYRISDILQNLEVLSLEYCGGVDDDLVKMLAEKCRKLRKLDLRHTQVSDIGISALAAVPTLKVLNISATHVTTHGIRTVAAPGHLERLYVMNMKRDENLIEESCIFVANCCPKIRLLNVSMNKKVTDRLVKEILSSVERGFLKAPFSLYVAGTNVHYNVNCDKIKLFYHSGALTDFSEMLIGP